MIYKVLINICITVSSFWIITRSVCIWPWQDWEANYPNPFFFIICYLKSINFVILLQKISFLFDVFTITIVAWSSQSFPLLCGPHPRHYDSGSVHSPSSQSAEASGGEEEPYSSASSDMSTPDWLEQVNGNSPLGCGEAGRQTVKDIKRFLPDALCGSVATATVFSWSEEKGISSFLLDSSLKKKIYISN